MVGELLESARSRTIILARCWPEMVSDKPLSHHQIHQQCGDSASLPYRQMPALLFFTDRGDLPVSTICYMEYQRVPCMQRENKESSYISRNKDFQKTETLCSPYFIRLLTSVSKKATVGLMLANSIPDAFLIVRASRPGK